MQLDPIPRSEPAPYRSFEWPAGDQVELSPRSRPLEVDLVALLERRESRREFGQSLPDSDLGDFLWLACRNRSSRPSPYGTNQESRVYPSAGAMHPIHIVLCRDVGPWLRYDPYSHALIELPGSVASAAAGRTAATHLLPLKKGTVIGLIAEPGRTAAKYSHYESLVWRDAGVVLGYMSLVAESLRLNFCPLGVSGHPYLTDYLPGEPALFSAGLAVLGPAET